MIPFAWFKSYKLFSLLNLPIKFPRGFQPLKTVFTTAIDFSLWLCRRDKWMVHGIFGVFFTLWDATALIFIYYDFNGKKKRKRKIFTIEFVMKVIKQSKCWVLTVTTLLFYARFVWSFTCKLLQGSVPLLHVSLLYMLLG